MSKRTNFARVPRNVPGNISSSGKTPDNMAPIRIDGEYIRKFHTAVLNRDLATILTRVDGTLSIEVQANKSATTRILGPDKKVLADEEDLVRIQTLSSEITKERKNALKVDGALVHQYTLAAMVRVGLENGLTISKFHKGFLEVYMTVETVMKTLVKNVQALESFVVADHSAQYTIKHGLLEMAKRIRIATGSYLFDRARLAGDETPIKMNEYLLREHVPRFFYDRLTNAVINMRSDGFKIETILFPKDISGGLYLTFKEINVGLHEHLMGLGDGARLVISLAQDIDLLREFMNVGPNVELVNFSVKGSLAEKIAATKFFIPPFKDCVGSDVIFDTLAKNGVRGVQWRVGSTMSPQDNLAFLGTVVKRAYYGMLIRPASQVQLLGEMFPSFTFDPSNEEARDVYSQLKVWSRLPNKDLEYFETFHDMNRAAGVGQGVARRATLVKVLCNVLGIDTNSALAARVQGVVVIAAAAKRLPRGVMTDNDDLYTIVKNRMVEFRTSRVNAVAEVGDRYAGLQGLVDKSRGEIGKKKKTRDPGRTERSILTEEAKIAIAKIGSTHVTLAGRMDSWFRQFLTKEVQSVVADLFVARLEAWLATPLIVTGEERRGFIDPDDIGDDYDADDAEDNPEEDPEDESEPENPDA